MFKDRDILLLAAGQTLVWATLFYSFPALLLRWERDLGWSKSELTAAITLAILASALCSPFTGRVIDRGWGPQLMFLSSVIGGVGLLFLSTTRCLHVRVFLGFHVPGSLALLLDV